MSCRCVRNEEDTHKAKQTQVDKAVSTSFEKRVMEVLLKSGFLRNCFLRTRATLLSIQALRCDVTAAMVQVGLATAPA